MPPAERESLRAVFVQCLKAESSSVTAEVAVPTVNDDEDYGYNETASDVTQCGRPIEETEASSHLADPDHWDYVAVSAGDRSLLSFTSTRSTQRSLLHLRLNDSLALVDKLRQNRL